ncbi:MAG: InlB B-repeat-containing protein [Ilumatobacteraceae bacterium]|nr:InlB B-repeat-containing protein [Ilumatobacteraceae bacterium]
MKKRFAYGTVSAVLIGLALGAPASNVTAENGTVDAIDCSNSLGLVQMFFNASTRTATAKQLVLDADAGSSGASNNYTDFSPAWTLSLNVPGDDDLKEINGSSINPLDGKAYGTARSDAGVEYLVRFDRDGDLEFLHSYSATTVNNGTFDSAGRFYSAASVAGSAVVQRWDNLHQSTGSTDPSSTAVTYRAADATGPLVTNVPADLARIEVGGVEYIIGVPNGTSNALMIFNTETLTSTSFNASSSVNRSGATGLPTGNGYGAAWAFEGTAYLSQNNGQGLWSITADDIDINAETATLRQILQSTQSTQSNDGFGCPSESLTEDEALPGSAGTAFLVFHANGGTGDPDDLQTTPTENVTLSAQQPSREGHNFLKWNSDSEGNGDTYSPSDAYVMPGDGETDHLYAQWQVVPATTTTTVAPTTTTTTPTTTTTAAPTTTTTAAPTTSTTAAPTTTTTTTTTTAASTTIPEVTSTLSATEADDEGPVQLPSTGASPFSGSVPILIGVVGLLALVATRRRVH